MNLKKFFINNKRKIIRYTGITLIIIGVAIIIWPLYTNFIMARREADILRKYDWNKIVQKFERIYNESVYENNKMLILKNCKTGCKY